MLWVITFPKMSSSWENGEESSKHSERLGFCFITVTLRKPQKQIVTLRGFPSLVVFLTVNFGKFLKNRNVKGKS